ncbi:Coenzyme F420 hydrogenase/dehydrogenase, beta subunit C-terminal domain [Butyrivibrio fibrisolvens]|uniref:Coenzyme F420 hydrogenase/dehydrogenase, beta subunit C-terminal domain n=1 Tax=Butyrivibrio fibrisolvens TaxID=831 RepID=UPI00041F369B|nr:Coenzyme F420 hydrogenase/dehydrogenase, beta subunit C-terminal domain [Butyrivibrio fibrisolvens]
MDKRILYEEMCTGCGLCHTVRNIEFRVNEKGFESPTLKEDDLCFCDMYCPSSRNSINEQQKLLSNNIWGKNESTYLGWAQNEHVRKCASSGGVLTTICIYLIEKRIVDGIIQVKVSDESPIKTTTVISRTKDEVLRCVGSRYTESMPLYDIKRLMNENETYAFIGKPCDASTLSLYKKTDKEIDKKIKYIFSFFCAGEPSIDANRKLLKRLNCENEDECQELVYRGNGWPGLTVATTKKGNSSYITYMESWGTILGRDTRKICRFCLDGIGLFSDIVCGDAWYANNDLSPDFSEHEGRNIIMARTKLGNNLIENMIKEGCIIAEDAEEYMKTIRNIQRYQYERKTTMISMILAMRLFWKKTPLYRLKDLWALSKDISIGLLVYRFVGTVKRIIMKRV